MADPFSLAAGSAGIASFIVQLLGGCIQGFIFLSTARNLGKDAATIVCMLNLQEIHLTEWARRAGLLSGDGTLDPRLNRQAVEHTLQQLRDLLQGTEKLKERYGLTLITHPRGSQQTSAQLEDAPVSESQQAATLISEETRQAILTRAGITLQQKTLKPLWWAAVDKEKIQKLVIDVRGFVDELRKMLDLLRQDDLIKSNTAIAAELISLNDRFDQLQPLAEALRTESLTSLASSAELKALRARLADDAGPESDQQDRIPSRPRVLESLEPMIRTKLGDFKPLRKNQTMGLADYDGERVFVEKKAINPRLRSKIMPRVESLAALLSLPKDSTFSSLVCRGIVEDDDQVSFVFHYPDSDGMEEPKTLLDLFSANGVEPPSLTIRIQLALQIVRIVQNFHRANWLHKSLRSENILFFASRDDISLLANPILAGFAFSRLGPPTEISEQPSADPKRDIYRHPHAMGEPTASFDTVMDIYSLGTLLLEIAEWRPLRYLVDSIVNVDAADVSLSKLTMVRPFLLSGRGKGGTSRLRMKVGNIYAETCLMCLSGEFEEAADKELSPLRGTPSWIDIVVRRLESCNI